MSMGVTDCDLCRLRSTAHIWLLMILTELLPPAAMLLLLWFVDIEEVWEVKIILASIRKVICWVWFCCLPKMIFPWNWRKSAVIQSYFWRWWDFCYGLLEEGLNVVFSSVLGNHCMLEEICHILKIFKWTCFNLALSTVQSFIFVSANILCSKQNENELLRL